MTKDLQVERVGSWWKILGRSSLKTQRRKITDTHKTQTTSSVEAEPNIREEPRGPAEHGKTYHYVPSHTRKRDAQWADVCTDEDREESLEGKKRSEITRRQENGGKRLSATSGFPRRPGKTQLEKQELLDCAQWVAKCFLKTRERCRSVGRSMWSTIFVVWRKMLSVSCLSGVRGKQNGPDGTEREDESVALPRTLQNTSRGQTWANTESWPSAACPWAGQCGRANPPTSLPLSNS